MNDTPLKMDLASRGSSDLEGPSGPSRNGVRTADQRAARGLSIVASVAETGTQRISVSLNSDEYVHLKAIAGSSQRSLGWVMRYALRRLLEEEPSREQLELPFGLAKHSGAHTEEEFLPNGINSLTNFNLRKVRRRTAGTIHSIHSYPTRFSPDVPGRLIEALSKPGQTVFDPFCGSGTTVAEAVRRDRRGIGVDISPLAVLISRTKCAHIREEDQAAIHSCVMLAKSLVHRLELSADPSAGGQTRFDVELRLHCANAGIKVLQSSPEAFP